MFVPVQSVFCTSEVGVMAFRGGAVMDGGRSLVSTPRDQEGPGRQARGMLGSSLD